MTATNNQEGHTMTDIDEGLADSLISEYIDLQAQIAAKQERIDEIKADLLTHLDQGTHPLEAGTVTISPNRRLDAKRFETDYPVAKNPGFYKTAPNTAAIKKEIGENAYIGYCTDGTPRVSIR
jgi:hypothetical protein